METIFSKIFDFIGVLNKELRLLAIVLIIHIVSFLLAWKNISTQHILGLFSVSTSFLALFFLVYCVLYYKQGILPYMVTYDIDGEWLYEVTSHWGNAIKVVTGKCFMSCSFSDVTIEGERTKIYEDWRACEKDGCKTTNTLRCEECGNCQTVNQRWSTAWGAVTRDNKLRFDYYFHVKDHVNQMGYCVVSLSSDPQKEMTGFLTGVPPQNDPGKIVFRKAGAPQKPPAI